MPRIQQIQMYLILDKLGQLNKIGDDKMPAIVGLVKIDTISLSGMFQVGDVFWTSPESEAVLFAGAGSYNVGDGLRTTTKVDINFITDVIK